MIHPTEIGEKDKCYVQLAFHILKMCVFFNFDQFL